MRRGVPSGTCLIIPLLVYTQTAGMQKLNIIRLNLQAPRAPCGGALNGLTAFQGDPRGL